MQIKIGNKNMAHLTGEHLIQIIMIIGTCPSFEYWNKPEILDFSNDTFSDTIVME